MRWSAMEPTNTNMNLLVSTGYAPDLAVIGRKECRSRITAVGLSAATVNAPGKFGLITSVTTKIIGVVIE